MSALGRLLVVAPLAALLGAALPGAAHAQHDSTAAHPLAAIPDSELATPAIVAHGRQVFHGQGGCFACHGAALEGGIGPTLRAHKWKDAGDGSLAAIQEVIDHGVPGTAMVSHPGGIDETAVNYVAAYVWAVSHGRAKP